MENPNPPLNGDPVDQEWIERYCRKYLELVADFNDPTLTKEAEARVKHVMDMLALWRRLPPGCTAV